MIDDPDVFFDTNILFYAARGKIDDHAKWQIAYGMLSMNFGTSGQVLAEFYVNSTSEKKKGGIPLSPEEAQRWVALLLRKPFVPVDSGIVRQGIANSQRYRISYWDGAVIAAAERLGCKTLYSEDLNHGQAYGSVTAIDPFI